MVMFSNFPRINGTKKVKKKRSLEQRCYQSFLRQGTYDLMSKFFSRIFRVSVIVYWSEEEEERARE